MKKYYKALRTEFVGPKNQILENTVIVFEETSNKKGKVSKIIEYQGALKPIKDSSIIDNILNLPDFLIQIDTPSDKFIMDYLHMPVSLKDKKKKFDKLKKEFPQYEGIFDTVNLWNFSTKGSPAVNNKKEKEFRKDPNKILSKTLTFGKKIGAKPGSFHTNRSLRTAPIGNQLKWENDCTTLLPNGIKTNESATFFEIEKMLDKRLDEIVNIYDTPKELVDRIDELFNIKKTYIYRTKFWLQKVSFFDFEKNTHHAKIKGLELCHDDPSLEFATTADNTYIGTCEENRHQGGYPLDFTWKKQLIMRIYKMDKTIDVESLEILDYEELEEIYFKNKF